MTDVITTTLANLKTVFTWFLGLVFDGIAKIFASPETIIWVGISLFFVVASGIVMVRHNAKA